MRTKHLFYTVALVSALAACTNDEFLEGVNAPQGEGNGSERPTISNVTLNPNGADTRLTFNGKYTFQDGDSMSVILMDENNTGVRYGITTNTDEWNKLTWLEKYHLVDYAHTNLPFIYEASKEVFNSNAKNVLEGNYFMILPYAPLDGNRQVRIDINKQVLIGDASSQEIRGKFIADNQKFVGYGQLMAEEGISDFEVSLTPILKPLRFKITHLGNAEVGDLHITKLVLRHKALTGTLTIDPTRAFYGDPNAQLGTAGWNLGQDYVKNHTDEPMTSSTNDIWHFNYANYLACQPATKKYATEEWMKEQLYANDRWGSELASDYVYNIKGEIGDVNEARDERKPNTYYWDDAIRAAVQPMREFNNPEYATQYIEVYLQDEAEVDYRTLESGKTIEAVMMLPALELKGEKGLMLSIYTKEGIIKDIDLSVQHTGINTDVQTSGIVDRVDVTDPTVETLEIKLGDVATVQYPTDVIINNENDLLQWVNWLNTGVESANKRPIAYFTNDITINDELAAAINQLKDNFILSIISKAAPGNNLRIATSADEYANILEKLDVASNVTVEVMDGAVLNMTEDSYNVKHKITSVPGWPDAPCGQLNIEVAKGGTLNIVSNDKTAIQGGFDNAGRPIANRTEVFIENMGKINVKNTQLVGFNITNEGEMKIEKGASLYFAPNSVNTIKGTINVDGFISGTTNNNFENKGTIENYGELRNIVNLGNKDNKKAGLINIWSWDAYTDISKNSGVIDYHEFLTGVNVNNTMSSDEPIKGGVFKYTGPAGTEVTKVDDEEFADDGTSGLQVNDLVNAYVTDAVITKGILLTNYADVTTLKNLTINEGAAIAKTATNNKLYFVEDVDMGSLLLKGGYVVEGTNKSYTTVDGVYFYNIADTGENVVIVGKEGDSEKKVVFKGEYVGFYKGQKAEELYASYAGIYFETAAAQVVNGCVLYAESLYSIGGTRSDVYNEGYIQLERAHDYQITVHTNTPNVVGK